ncbi:MAG: hypothetical protein IJ899_18100 [Blautia sp.]|nr:hypothetical protein [Blautia sp.]
MKKEIAKILMVIALLAVVLLAIDRISGMQQREEAAMVRDAVHEAALTCYAVEGMYPDSVEYLREHYHLAYNEERFLVTFDAFASNKIPNIYVTERGAGAP